MPFGAWRAWAQVWVQDAQECSRAYQVLLIVFSRCSRVVPIADWSADFHVAFDKVFWIYHFSDHQVRAS